MSVAPKLVAALRARPLCAAAAAIFLVGMLSGAIPYLTKDADFEKLSSHDAQDRYDNFSSLLMREGEKSIVLGREAQLKNIAAALSFFDHERDALNLKSRILKKGANFDR